MLNDENDDDTTVLAVPTATAENTLTSDAQLSIGEHLYSKQSKYELFLRPDGNLVEYAREMIWSTNTGNVGENNGMTNRFIVEPNGNVIVYDFYDNDLWSSNTGGSIGIYSLKVEDTGVIALYNAQGTKIWTK